MASEVFLPELGIPDIDDQHRQLLACLERLELWVGKGQGFAAALDALNTLNDYVASHFSFEEAFLQDHGYPLLAEHVQQHQAISDALARLTRQVLDGGDISGELVTMLREWILKHIGEDDCAFAAFLTAR